MTHGHLIMTTIAIPDGYGKWTHLTLDAKVANREWGRLINRRRNNRYRPGLKNLKWLDSLTIAIGLNLRTCDPYQDNLSASKIINRITKTKQLKHLFKQD